MEIEEIKRYVSYEEGGRLLELNKDTIRNYTKELKESGLIGKRYPREILIDCGKIVRIWLPALADYMTNRKRLRDKNMSKYVGPFSCQRKLGLCV